MKRIIAVLLLVIALPAFGLTQERIKFPVGFRPRSSGSDIYGRHASGIF